MLVELREDRYTPAAGLREAHNVCDQHPDIGIGPKWKPATS